MMHKGLALFFLVAGLCGLGAVNADAPKPWYNICPPDVSGYGPPVWYDLGFCAPGRSFVEWDQKCACDYCMAVFHDRWDFRHVEGRKGPDGEDVYGVGHPVAFEPREWIGPKWWDHPNCNIYCCAIKARLIFGVALARVYQPKSWSYIPNYSRERANGDLPGGLLPFWGGYYWQYRAAIEATKRYVRDGWQSSIEHTRKQASMHHWLLEEYEAGRLGRPEYWSSEDDWVTIPMMREQIAREDSDIALKRQIIPKELAILDEAHERIHSLFVELSTYTINYKEGDDDDWSPPAVLLDAGLLAYERGDSWGAIDALRRLVDAPEDTTAEVLEQAHLLLGKACVEAKLYVEAVQNLTILIQANPDNKEAYFHRAWALFEMGEFEDSFADLAVAEIEIEESPRSSVDKLLFATGMVEGIRDGVLDSASEFLPTIGTMIKGAANGLWAFAADPQGTSIALVDSVNEAIEFLRSSEIKEVIGTVFPEVGDLIGGWTTASDRERGRLVGQVIGKYGTDILLWGGSIKAVSAARRLHRANALMTMKACAAKAKDFGVISGQIAKANTARATMFEGCRHIKAYNPGHVFSDTSKFKHIFGKSKHHLEVLAAGPGWEGEVMDKVTRAVLRADRQGVIELDAGRLFSVQVDIGKHVVEVRGAVVKNELRYGTMFVVE